LVFFQTQCSHIVWLENTAPLKRDDANDTTAAFFSSQQYPQTIQNIHEYNHGVRDMLSKSKNKGITQHTTTMDVFEASLGWPHNAATDNIHMDWHWYTLLGRFFLGLAKCVAEIEKVKGLA
jgi:hypothetical protein